MRGYEIRERAAEDVKALGEAHAISYGAFHAILEADYHERCKEIARKALENLQRTWDERDDQD